MPSVNEITTGGRTTGASLTTTVSSTVIVTGVGGAAARAIGAAVSNASTHAPRPATVLRPARLISPFAQPAPCERRLRRTQEKLKTIFSSTLWPWVIGTP